MLTVAQRKARSTCIGSSDIAAIAGVSRYRTPYQVWADKRGLVEPAPENEHTRAGHALQPVVAHDYFAREPGAVIRTTSDWIRSNLSIRTRLQRDGCREAEVLGLVRDPKRPHFGASPDYFAEFAGARELALLEIKTASLRNLNRWGETGSDSIPEEYICQVQWQMMVTGAPLAYVAVLIGGVHYRWYRIERSPSVIDALAAAGEQFWFDYILSGVPPPADPGSKDAAAELRRQFPQADEGKVLELGGDDEAVSKLLAAKAACDRAEADYETARQAMMTRLGNSAKAFGAWGSVRWQNVKGRKTTDWKSLAIEAGVSKKLIEKHTRTGNPSRTLIVNIEEGGCGGGG